MPAPLLSPPIADIPSDPQQPRAVEVVVIGGGMSGIAAAGELARRGTSVAVVEKGRIGAEQSGRNWGWCRQQNRDERELPLAMLALRIWGGMPEAAGFRRRGLIYASQAEADIARWEAWGRMARGHGVDTRMLSAAELAALLPDARGRWRGGVHSPTDGRAEPGLAMAALAGAARAAGATLHQDCAAREIEFTAGRVSGVLTEAGRIACGTVLVAGGAWAGMLLRHHRVPFLQASIQATSFTTGPLPEVTAGGLSLQDVTLGRRADGGYTVGLSGFGRLHVAGRGILQTRAFWKTFLERRGNLSYGVGRLSLMGPDALCRWTADRPSPFERLRILGPAPERRLMARGLTRLAEAFPALAGAEVARAWGGMMDFTPDALPVIGPVAGRPGLYISAGHSGHGFGVGPAAGRLAADLIRGDAPCVDPRPFRYERMVDGTDLGAMGMI